MEYTKIKDLKVGDMVKLNGKGWIYADILNEIVTIDDIDDIDERGAYFHYGDGAHGIDEGYFSCIKIEDSEKKEKPVLKDSKQFYVIMQRVLDDDDVVFSGYCSHEDLELEYEILLKNYTEDCLMILTPINYQVEKSVKLKLEQK